LKGGITGSDEWVWKDVKNDNGARIVPDCPGQLIEILTKALRMLRNMPEQIRSFCSDPHLACIRRLHLNRITYET
jgi:hypothetical protein